MDDQANKIGAWVDVLLKTLDNIANGNEALVYIKLFKTHSENFLSLIQRIKMIKEPPQFYENLIKTRTNEIEEFENYYRALKKFVNLCRNYNNTCNLKVYEDILENFFKQVDYNLYIFKPLNNFVKIREVTEIKISPLGDYKPVVTYLPGIDIATIGEIRKINGLQRSKCILFDDYFLQECKKNFKDNKDQPINLQTLIKVVWPMTTQRWLLVAKSIETGEIKLNEIDSYLNYYRTKEKMLQEFEYICSYFKS